MLRALALITKNTTYLFDALGFVVRQPRVAGSPNYTGMTDDERYEVVRRPDMPTYEPDEETQFEATKFAVRDSATGDILHINTSRVSTFHYLSDFASYHDADDTWFSPYEAEGMVRGDILRYIVLHPETCHLGVNYKGRVYVNDEYGVDRIVRKAAPGLFREDREKIVERVLNDNAIIKVEIDPYTVEGLCSDREENDDALDALRRKLTSN